MMSAKKLLVALSIVSACGKDKPLFAVIDATDVECKAGGYVFLAGTDQDGNDTLSDYEVTASHLVCNGADAEPSVGKIKRTFHCEGVFDDSILWRHEVVLFSSGSTWSFANIITPDETANGSSFDPPSVTKWSIAKTEVILDVVDDPGVSKWELRLDLQTHSTSVMYFDQDLPGDGLERQLFHDACIVDEY